MDTQTIDQAPSELALHRVLWLLKFLRGVVLHVFLALGATLAYFLAGIDNLYPIANDIIRLAKAQGESPGAAMSATAYGLLVWIVFVALLAFLVWVYLSILHVRRRALRIQAVLYLLIYAWNAPGKWQELEFAFENLDIRFAVLAAFGTAMVFVVFPLALVVTLWVVSRATETSSFTATLDPRLAPGVQGGGVEAVGRARQGDEHRRAAGGVHRRHARSADVAAVHRAARPPARPEVRDLRQRAGRRGLAYFRFLALLVFFARFLRFTRSGSFFFPASRFQRS